MVYLLCGADSEPVYIGSTTRVRRFYEHQYQRRVWPAFCAVYPFADEPAARAAERELIRHYQPPGNRVLYGAPRWTVGTDQ